ncbi:MAG: gamma-glutamylcyclotransferase [Candidatus Thorarchaeota archaeon]|nr:MAG: gamma-glutamylcyclotransferase [Candidatus Thorarchaeota archaeon]
MASPDSNQWLVGYGTFITRGTWKRYSSCRVCRVPGLRRVYDPEMAWFPFAIVDKQTEILAVCFLVDEDRLDYFDRYEGVEQGLYERAKREILVREDNETWVSREAWIYLPTSGTMQHPHFPWEDSDDRWLRERIRKSVELQDSFPQFFQSKGQG